MELAPGARLGPYEIQARLDAGGMGVVYQAHDSRLKRTVAVKVLHESVVRDPDRLRRFETEARAAGALNHPNILAVFDTGTADGVPYLVTELLEGETLRERLAGGGLRRGKALEFGVQIAEGLAAAHEKGIVHRDLKPENLFLTKDGRIKILDFGLAKLREEPKESMIGSDTGTVSKGTESGVILGTVGYMSPEQVRAIPADHRSDIFSFGAVLFEMLTGRRAFRGETPPETMTAILRTDPVATVANADGGPAIELGLQRLLGRCLEKKAEDRFQSARDLAFHIRSLGEGSGLLRGAARGRGPGWRVLSAAALLAVLTGALGVVSGRWSRPESKIPRYTTLTHGQGVVVSARFGPDKATAYYSAEQPGRTMEIFSTWGNSNVSRTTGVKDAKLLAVSRQGDMAILLHPRLTTIWVHRGTLARVSVSGGTPRQLLEDVQDADFGPDGESLAVVRWVEDRCRLEFPVNRTLYEPTPPAWISEARVSPAGDRVAFAEHPIPGDLRGSVKVIDLRGRTAPVGSEFTTFAGLAWSDDGHVVSAGYKLEGQEIYVSQVGGRERLVARPAASMNLLDAIPGGRTLMARHVLSTPIWGRAHGVAREQDLADRDFAFIADISLDGQVLVGTWQNETAGRDDAVFLQRTEGGSPVRLGDGDALSLSPDARWVLGRLPRESGERLLVIPTGVGETKELPTGEVRLYYEAKWFPDGRRVVFSGAKEGSAPRLYVQDVSDGLPRPLSPDDYRLPSLGASVSPDGRRILAFGPDGAPVLYPVDGGNPAPIPELLGGDVPIAWTADGRGVFYYDADDPTARIHRLDLGSRRSQVWKELVPVRPAGIVGQYRIVTTPDGGAYAYNYTHMRGDLVLAEDLN